MEVKEYLQYVDRYDRRIQYKLNELYRLKVLSTSISATANDDVRVQHSMNGGKLENTVIKLIDLEREIDELVDEMVDRKATIIRQIESLEDVNQYSVLMERYVEKKSFEEIAVNLHYSRKQINRIHGEALANFEKKYAQEIEYVSQNVI